MKQKTQSPVAALERAISIVGGPGKLAKHLSVRGPTIYTWMKRVPAERCPQIERITDGQVRCEDLRPDMEWDIVRKGNMTKKSTSRWQRNFHEFWLSLKAPERDQFATSVMSTVGYLNHLGNGYRSPGKHLKLALDSAVARWKESRQAA